MSVNASSFGDLCHSLHDFSNSSSPPLMRCFRTKASIIIFSTFSITHTLLLPIFYLVLYLGYQQWRKHHSTSMRAAFNSDVFTYHSIAMQLNESFGLILYFCGGYRAISAMMEVGLGMWVVTTMGQAMFQLLSCVDYYLAVVHPITYLGLRRPRGIRTRNITVGCVWLLSFGWLVVMYHTSAVVHFLFYLSSLAVFLIVICVGGMFVLCALRRPGPGEVVGKRGHVDRSKQKAFHIILAVMGVLLIRFCGNLAGNVLYRVDVLSKHVCVVFFSAFWMDLPSNLVLPLLFLRRARKRRR